MLECKDGRGAAETYSIHQLKHTLLSNLYPIRHSSAIAHLYMSSPICEYGLLRAHPEYINVYMTTPTISSVKSYM